MKHPHALQRILCGAFVFKAPRHRAPNWVPYTPPPHRAHAAGRKILTLKHVYIHPHIWGVHTPLGVYTVPPVVLGPPTLTPVCQARSVYTPLPYRPPVEPLLRPAPYRGPLRTHPQVGVPYPQGATTRPLLGKKINHTDRHACGAAPSEGPSEALTPEASPMWAAPCGQRTVVQPNGLLILATTPDQHTPVV